MTIAKRVLKYIKGITNFWISPHEMEKLNQFFTWILIGHEIWTSASQQWVYFSSYKIIQLYGVVKCNQLLHS
jgi:hypothetical protein